MYVHIPVTCDAHGCGRRRVVSPHHRGGGARRGGRGLKGGMGVVIP